ncbi:MAG TPA: carboxypeptidase-like regulatory domain-containing protein [Anaerolineales bacterium]|nr:carboxypeptidase-like regulatory domain-containing protein [Anaerolineales bacterium]HNN14532.1 carboxypeptidase-like regulatory domain-containing protein [Anaerolineales bacterium]HNO32262.1 carboxypeptidase-like regulatory domain-containing protein [Anaerolineales bacterium]
MNKKHEIAILGITGLWILACSAGLQPATPTLLPEATRTSSPLDASKVYIEGDLSWDGPLANVSIDLYVIESSVAYASITTDADGKFSFPALDPMSPGFGVTIAIPVSAWKCSEPVPSDQAWFKSARAFQVAEDQVNISLISDANKEIPTGEIISMNIALQCP